MKEKIKNALKCTQLFVKKNKMSCICFLLAVLVTISGTFSFAKYISGDSISKRPGAATMHASSEITGVSALSFTNTDFWALGKGDENDIAMNSLRSIDLVVNNFEIDGSGNKIVSDVRMEYELTFLAPVAFTENFAFQLLDEDGSPITTQMIMGHFIDAAHKHESHIAEGKAKYNGVDVDHDHVFTFVANDDESVITCTTDYKLPEGGTAPLTIRIEKISQPVQQMLMFRAWDTSALGQSEITVEGGKLLPPVRAVIQTEVPMYKISIHLPTFVFEPGSEQSTNYRMTVVPTKALHDNHLGSFIQVYGGTDGDGNAIYITPNTLIQGDMVYFSAITETVYESNTELGIDADWGKAVDTYHIPSMKVYNVGDSIEDDDTRTRNYTNTQDATKDVSGIDGYKDKTLSSTTVKTYTTSEYLYLDSNFSSTNFWDASYRVTGTITKTQKIDYSDEAVGTETTTSGNSVSKSVVSVSGDNMSYVVKTVKTVNPTVKSFEGDVSYVENTTYEFNVTSFEIRVGNWWQENWSPYVCTSDNLNTIISNLGYTSPDPSSGKKDYSVETITPESTEITYEKFVRERIADENNYAEIKQLSQMIYNADGTSGIIYYDGADPSKDIIIENTDAAGNTITIVKEKHEDSLNFSTTLDGKTTQVLFLSACYSKEYPMSLTVVFKQIQ